MLRPWIPISLLSLSVGAFGCGDAGDSPPFNELELRDALQAAPEVIAELTTEERSRLADRMQDEYETERPAVVVAGGPELWERWPQEQLQFADAELIDSNEDAIVLAVVYSDAHDAELASVTLDPARLEALEQQRPELPPLEGEPAQDTAALETAALEGRAGAILQDLMNESGARQLTRISGWPIGAISVEDRIFVNGAWLVALSPSELPSLDPGRFQLPGSARSRRARPVPVAKPYLPESRDVDPQDKHTNIVDVVVTTSITVRAAQDGCERCTDSCNESCERSCDNACDNVCDTSCNESETSSSSNCQQCSVHKSRGSRASWLWMLAPLATLFVGSRRWA